MVSTRCADEKHDYPLRTHTTTACDRTHLTLPPLDIFSSIVYFIPTALWIFLLFLCAFQWAEEPNSKEHRYAIRDEGFPLQRRVGC